MSDLIKGFGFTYLIQKYHELGYNMCLAYRHDEFSLKILDCRVNDDLFSSHGNQFLPKILLDILSIQL